MGSENAFGAFGSLGRFFGRLKIGGFVVRRRNDIFSFDNILGQLLFVFLPALFLWWAYAAAFSRKAKAYFSKGRAAG